jgi:outer membrane protein OmpA-like peptidoglycan-associated protein
MPVKRKRVVRHVPKREPDVAIAEQVTAPVDVPTAQPKPPPKKVANVVKQPPVRTAAPPPRRTQTAAAQPNTGLSFTFDGSQPDYAAQVQREAEAQKASRTAALTESPSSGGNSSNLARRSQIIFAAGAPAPAANALDAIKMLGGDLSSALQAGAERIQLQAYGGPRNDKSSDSRRLSLKRAIAIRQILISAGVPGTKIDVRAMGGADAGPPDRVDVFVRS